MREAEIDRSWLQDSMGEKVLKTPSQEKKRLGMVANPYHFN
jgi:hypothetical protein